MPQVLCSHSLGLYPLFNCPPLLNVLSLFAFPPCLCGSVSHLQVILRLQSSYRGVGGVSAGCGLVAARSWFPCPMWSPRLSPRSLAHTRLIFQLNRVKRAYLLITIKLFIALLSYTRKTTFGTTYSLFCRNSDRFIY